MTVMDAPAVQLADKAQSSIPDYVMHWVVAGFVLVALWLGLKALARRGHLKGWYRGLDPRVQALTRWVWGAPVVFTYIATWTVTSVIQQGAPESLASLLSRYQSTNIAGLATQPGRVLFSSAFVVAENAAGFMFYVVIYVLIAARLEHRVGAPRFLFIAMTAHVLGSLLTVLVELWAIDNGHAPPALKFAKDVGVSYVMVGSLGAYLWLIGRRWLPWYSLALAAGVVLPMFISQTVWDLGHFLATALGIAAGWIATRYPLRTRLGWRELVASLPPRRLPTFIDQPRPWPDSEFTSTAGSSG